MKTTSSVLIYVGSFIHAKSLFEQKFEVKLMLSVEMIGHYSDRANSQTFPIALLELDYPTVGNFIGLVSDLGNHNMVREVKEAMRNSTIIPVISINAPKALSESIFQIIAATGILGIGRIKFDDQIFVCLFVEFIFLLLNFIAQLF